MQKYLKEWEEKWKAITSNEAIPKEEVIICNSRSRIESRADQERQDVVTEG